MTDADFRDAFHRHKDIVYRFAYRMSGSGSTAEDVVQDCFVAFWQKPDAYDPDRGALRAVSFRSRAKPGSQALASRTPASGAG